MLRKHAAIFGRQYHRTQAVPNIGVTDLDGGVPDLTLSAPIKLNAQLALRGSFAGLTS
jgi:hypothetical protein